MIRRFRCCPGDGKTKLGRLWTYVRVTGQPVMLHLPRYGFTYSPDRRGQHPHRHLATFQDTLQADGYAGFNRLYDSGRICEAACWAHVRRKFFDLQQCLTLIIPKMLIYVHICHYPVEYTP